MVRPAYQAKYSILAAMLERCGASADDLRTHPRLGAVVRPEALALVAEQVPEPYRGLMRRTAASWVEVGGHDVWEEAAAASAGSA